ncbi:MAG TPA: IS3 family transposase [Chryseolinea sp.]
MSKGCTISSACRHFHRSRQSYYKALRRREKRFMESEKLLDMVQPIRQIMPRLGGRKLFFMLQQSLAENAVQIGRDKFFEWLKGQDLLIRPKRSYVRTTQSRHRFRVYDNLTGDLMLTTPNQLWVSDITYLRTWEGFCYLALITDAYSRKIVGYDVSDSLEMEGCIRALKAACQTASDLSQLIHHSDRGTQYCAGPYTQRLQQQGIKISMAATGNCYENALAERVNGILKDEFNLDTTFKSKEQAMKAVHQSISIYNQYRPHWALNFQTPQHCHAA